jgi:hypothetical protein
MEFDEQPYFAYLLKVEKVPVPVKIASTVFMIGSKSIILL